MPGFNGNNIIFHDNGAGDGDITFDGGATNQTTSAGVATSTTTAVQVTAQTLTSQDVATVSGIAFDIGGQTIDLADFATVSGTAGVNTTIVPQAVSRLASEILTTVSGVATTNMDFLEIMDNIMVNVLGWEVATKPVDTPISLPAPSYKAIGAFQAAAGGTNLTIPWPAGHAVDDVALLWVQNYNQAAFNLITPAGFTLIATVAAGSPSGVDPTHQSGVYWCRASGISQPSPVLENADFAGASDYSLGVITTYSGCARAGLPYDVFNSDITQVNVTAGTVPSITTTVNNTLVVLATLGARDNAVSGFNNDYANATISNIGNYNNNASAVGNGGNINTADGIKTTVGSTGTTSESFTNGQSRSHFIIALQPPVVAREYWWRSEGEEPGDRMPLYCGLLASGTSVYTRAATCADTVTSGVSDTMTATTISTVLPWPDNKKFWVSGNKDFVHFFSDSANAHHTGGMGYLNSYYNYKDDPYPVCVYGQTSDTSTFSATRRLLAYTASPFAIATQSGVAGGGFLATTASGAFGSYITDDYSTILQLNAPALRSGKYSAFRKTFYIEQSTSTTTREIRGDLPYMWQVWNGPLFIGEPVVGSGYLFDSDQSSPAELFVCTNTFGQNDNTFLIGPTDEFDQTDRGQLYTISGTKLYLSGDRGVDRVGGSFRGGRVKTWRDQSNNPKMERLIRNDANQTIATSRPTPTSAGTFGSSYDVVTLASGSLQYMTGTVPVALEGGSIFIVASYKSGTHRTPILNIRGNLSAQDTLFSLEFNESASNSATAVNTAGGGTDRVQITGLSPNTRYLVTNVVSGTNTTLYVNGSTVGASTLNNTKGVPAVSGSLNYSIGVSLLSGGSVGTSYASADVAEIIYLHKPVSEAERRQIHCYLSEKYSLSVADVC